MAGRLDDKLPPGERVVYRSPPNISLAWLLVPLLAGLAGAWGFFFGPTDITFDEAFQLFYLLLAGMLLMLVGDRLSGDTAVVTERRLLYGRGPAARLWGRQRVHDIPHAEIAEIRAFGGSFDVRLADGRAQPLGNIADHYRLAAALSAASGVPISQPWEPAPSRS